MSSKTREALEEIVDMGTCYFPDFTLPKDDDELQDAIIEKAPDYTSLRDDFIKAVIIARTALAEPVRNCDVGSAEEQIRRIRSHCKQHRVEMRCIDCPVKGVFPKDCALIWSQMPYEEVKKC